MPPLVLLAIAALSISLPILAWSIFTRPSREHRQAVTNLQRGLLDARHRPDQPPPPNRRAPKAFALSRGA